MTLHIGLLAAGGFFGAVSRFAVSQWIDKRFSFTFPYATLSVNLAGSLLLGVIVGSHPGPSWQLLLGTGFMGAFTTFSTFKLESVGFGIRRRWRMFAGYLAASYIGGIFLAFLGILIGIG